MPTSTPEATRTTRARGFGASLPALIIGVIGMLAALLLPFAPVVTEDTTVTWPQAGREPESTTAFFVPYAPANVRVDVPCGVVRAGQDRAGPTTLVGSGPPGKPTEGFAVTTSDGELLVLLGGREVYRAPIPADDCSVRIDAGADGSTVDVGPQRIDLPGDRVREISAFSTDLSPDRANGLRVDAGTSTWFENSPTGGKIALAVGQLVLAAASLVLLVRGDRRRRAGTPSRTDRRARLRAGWLRRMPDVAIVAALGAWMVLGPRTPDDGFTEGIVRNALDTGAFTNYYRWENAAESPFTLVLFLVEPLVAAHANPLVMRMPSVVAGLLTWLLISRGVLPVVLPEHARLTWVRALCATSVLAWWLPFDLGVRPEPFVALGTVAVLTCLLRATAKDDGAGLALLGLGGLAAGLTIAVNPVGITAAAPIVLLAPRIWRTLRRSGSEHERPPITTAALLALIGSLAAVGLVAMFVDQSFYGVSRATEMHGFYGPNVGWFEEIRRYEYLLGFDEQGGMGRRLPVLSTIALVVSGGLVLARGGRELPGMRLSYLPVASLVLALGMLWFTPSKWTHYFGALAGLGAVALTTSVVLLGVAARHWSRQRTVLSIGVLGTCLSVLAASLAFAGTNTWFLYSHYGVPRDQAPFAPLNTPLTWLLLVAVLLAVPLLPRFAGRVSPRGMLVRMPAVIGSVTMVLTVVVVIVSFAVAPARQAGSYSVGGQNFDQLAGGSCGIVDRVVTTRDAPGGLLDPATGTDELTGFTPLGGYPSSSPPPVPAGTGSATHLWGSAGGGPISTGRMTSQWFALPDIGRSQELALWVAGRTGDGNRLALEFGRTTDGAPQPVGERVLDDAYKDSDERPTYPSDRVVEDEPQDDPSWRSLHVEEKSIPEGTNVVRVRAVDATTDAGGWIAVTSPRIRDVAPLRPSLLRFASVYVDWSMVWEAHCVSRSPRVGNGLVEAPTALLVPPADLGFDGQASFVEDIGGSFAAVDEVGRRTAVPTRLLGTEDTPEYEDWGEFVTVSYPMRRDAYDTRTTSVPRWGWEGDRSPLGRSAE